ncbi:hypothetical protein JW835_09380 [bacterium]|nr:hypothetical protein [bacterium]
MVKQKSFIAIAVLFFIFAAAFSVVLWPDVSAAAKIAFFATGVGCGVGIGQYFGRQKSKSKN